MKSVKERRRPAWAGAAAACGGCSRRAASNESGMAKSKRHVAEARSEEKWPMSAKTGMKYQRRVAAENGKWKIKRLKGNEEMKK